MDALSEILKTMKMRHTAVGTLRLSAPWGLRIQDFGAPVAYGLVGGPACWLRLPGQDSVKLEQGDIALCLRASWHCISSSIDTPCEDFVNAWQANGLPEFMPSEEPESPLCFEWGGGGVSTQLLGLAFGLPNRQLNPLLAALPELIVLRSGRSSAFPWMRPAIDFLSVQDASSPGFAATARIFAELVFVTIVRSHLLHEPRATRGWLRGLADPGIARALQAVHAQPGADWTVASLAQVAGLSRTALATRFAELVETSPIEYLTQWRMHLAVERIVRSRPNLSQLAFELGYTSDAAFRDAFKRRYGVPPSRYMDTHASEETESGLAALPP